MNHFNPKTLTFYGVAIAAVVLLFNRVTAYGETNLKAPNNIEGLYQINARNLPSCLKTDSPVLKLAQSGAYLTGSLKKDVNSAKATISEEKPSLTGQWQGGKLSLSGPVNQDTCPPDTQMEINGSIDQKRLSGQFRFNADPPVRFTAQREADDESGQAAH
jgi:hypothetical protein